MKSMGFEKALLNFRALSTLASALSFSFVSSFALAKSSEIRGVVEAQKGLTIPKSTTLYVIARRPKQGPMPIAVRRVDIKSFPVSFAISSSDLMMRTGADFTGQFELTIRLDQDGNATTRQAGDLIGKAFANVGDTGVKIVLSEVLP
jgi:hypothetical protein